MLAKGIATQEEMITLQTMGCELAQGSFLGEPVPAEAVVEPLFDASPSGMVAEGGQYRP